MWSALRAGWDPGLTDPLSGKAVVQVGPVGLVAQAVLVAPADREVPVGLADLVVQADLEARAE